MSAHNDADANIEDLELTDEELVSRRRIESILDWYNTVLERTDELENAVVRGKLTRSQADILTKNTVTRYVEDALKTLRGKGLDKYIKSNNDYVLGQVRITAPSPYQVAWRQARPADRIGPDPPTNPDSMPPQYTVTNPDVLTDVVYEIGGLEEFANCPAKFSETYEVTINGPSGEQSHSLTASQAVPRGVSMTAFRDVGIMLNELGMDVSTNAYQHGKT